MSTTNSQRIVTKCNTSTVVTLKTIVHGTRKITKQHKDELVTELSKQSNTATLMSLYLTLFWYYESDMVSFWKWSWDAITIYKPWTSSYIRTKLRCQQMHLVRYLGTLKRCGKRYSSNTSAKSLLIFIVQRITAKGHSVCPCRISLVLPTLNTA